MLLLWILFLIILIILLKYVYLIAKRLLLIKKIKKQAKKYGGKLCNYRHPLTSIFKHDGKTDFMIAGKEKCINVSVITTPFRRVRYHFDNNTHLEIIFCYNRYTKVKRKEPKTNTKENHQITKEEIKRRKGQKRATKLPENN